MIREREMNARVVRGRRDTYATCQSNNTRIPRVIQGTHVPTLLPRFNYGGADSPAGAFSSRVMRN
jgi:hypothetical protein